MKINLMDVTDNGRVHNLSGKGHGENVREHFDLDRLDEEDGCVEVIVPNDIYAISSSFFSGMFSRSIQNLGGEERFLEKYIFRSHPELMRQIYHGLSHSSAERNIMLA